MFYISKISYLSYNATLIVDFSRVTAQAFNLDAEALSKNSLVSSCRLKIVAGQSVLISWYKVL